MDTNPLIRARNYLRYASSAKWTAIISGAATSIFYVLLLVVLSLFVDLLITHGRIPTYSELSIPEQMDFVNRWQNLSDETRASAIQHLGYDDFANISADEIKKLTNEDKQRYLSYKDLISKEDLPPILDQATSEEWQEWATKRAVLGNVTLQATQEQEVRWRAYLWNYLREHVTPVAANSFQPQIEARQPYPLTLTLGTPDRTGYGILSTIVHQRNTIDGRLLSFLASWNPWMWSPTPTSEANQRYLTGLLLVATIFVALRAFFLVLMKWMAAKATVEAVTRLRRAIYHHTSRLGNLTIRTGAGNESNGLYTHHIEAVHDSLYAYLTHLFRFPLQFFLCLVVAFLAHPLLAFIFLAFAALVWIVGGQLTAAFRRQSRRASRQVANQSALLLESLKLMRLVKAYLMEFFNQSRVERQLSDHSEATLKRSRGESLARPVFVLLALMGTIALLYLAGRLILVDGTDLVNLFLLLISFMSLYLPITARFEYRKFYRRGRESSAVIFEFLDRRSDVAQMGDAEFLQPMSKQLEFLDVSLRDPGSTRMLLKGITLKLPAGQKIALVGPDENEKLALIYLLPRFFDPSTGEVRIDGRNLKWVTNDSLRAQIGLVLQGNLVFNDTVRNNIGCGEGTFSLPQIVEAAKLAHAHQFIQRLPHGYETPIGEFGHSLRPGEKFRIALARAILRDPSILVVEEPVHPFDDDTKALIDDSLVRFLGQRTVIYLPHRVSTLKHCDQIILLNEGQVEATGTHRELIKSSPLYQHLHYLEFNVFAEQA